MKYATVLLLLTVILLAGCGQKGPLYLPSNEPAPQNTQTQSGQTEQTGQVDQAVAPDSADTEQP